MIIARILCVIVLLLEARGLSLSVSDRKWKILVFYTQLSNLAATVSALLLVVLGQPMWVTMLRYLSTCMLAAWPNQGKERHAMSEKIIGQRFGMLVVQSEIEPVRDARGHLVRMFNCLCDCGKEKVFRYNNLMSGLVNSCGCTRIPKDPRVDLSGRRFGHLTVLFEAEPHYEKCGKKIRCWACLCDCGNETVIFQSNLVSQHGTRSCGCALKYGGRPVKSTVNLTGNRYGRLVVIAPADPAGRPGGSHRYRWLCRCDCGNETIVAGDNLTSGHTQSCGCLKKDKVQFTRDYTG